MTPLQEALAALELAKQKVEALQSRLWQIPEQGGWSIRHVDQIQVRSYTGRADAFALSTQSKANQVAKALNTLLRLRQIEGTEVPVEGPQWLITSRGVDDFFSETLKSSMLSPCFRTREQAERARAQFDLPQMFLTLSTKD